MAQSAAHPIDEVIPRVPVRQWVLSFPIPLRILFAAHPELLTSVLRIIHRVIAGFLLKQAALKNGVTEELFDRVVVPINMTHPDGAAPKATAKKATAKKATAKKATARKTPAARPTKSQTTS